MTAARAPRKFDEDKLQASIVAAFRAQFECVIFHVPNGGRRSKSEAAKLKWVGVLAGVPDLVVLAPDGRVLFLECKTPKGRESPEQTALMDRLWSWGHHVQTVRTLDVALAVGKNFGLLPKLPPIRSQLEQRTGF